MKTHVYFSIAFLFGLIVSSCGPSRSKIISVDPGFSNHISAYSSGMISRDETIRIELAEPSKKILSMDSASLTALFEFEPHVLGKAIAISDRIIEFAPKVPLEINQFYTIAFELGELKKVESKYEEFVFQLATKRQKIEVDFDGLENYNSYQIENQFLTGSVKVAEIDDTINLKKILSATLNGKTIPIRWTNCYPKVCYFSLDSIKRKAQEQELVVSWNGKALKSYSSGEQKFRVASLGDFTINDIKIHNDEDQSIDLYFSDPLEPNQNLNGIISVKGIENLSFSIHKNKVTAFLPKRYEGEYSIHVSTGIKNIAGYKMNAAYSDQIQLRDANPQVKIIGKGSILPNSQGLIFPFKAIALKSVSVRIIKIYEKNVHYFLQVNDLDGDEELTRFGKIIAEKKINLDPDKKLNLKQWNNHIINLENIIRPEPGAIYQVAIKFEKEDITCNCPESEEDSDEYYEENMVDDEWNEYNWHTYGFNGYSSWSYDYETDENPCDRSFFYGKAQKRNILASNLGMIFKLDEDKTSHAFISDMTTTKPIANCNVTYYDYVKNVIGTATTNSQGMATLKLKEKPFLMIATYGTQKGYLKLTDGLVNSLSKFDVAGEEIQKGVKGFIYGERSVWRPGDSLFLTFMLQDKLNVLPENHPLKFELFDPSGNSIYNVSKNSSLNGVYDFRTATNENAPTGNYLAQVSVGNKTYTKYLKIETIKPNRLKIDLDLYGKSVHDSIEISASWLHGASAKDLSASVSMYLSPLKTKIKGYDDFVFDSPIRSVSSEKHTVFNGKLNNQGKAKFRAQALAKDAPGKVQANYITKVFEKSGNYSIDRKTDSYSPFSSYVGLKVPESSKYDNTLETDKKHTFQLANVNENGQKIAKNTINIKIYEVKWNWWYDGDETDLTDFVGRKSTILIREENINTNKGLGQFEFAVKYPDFGEYMIIATDMSSGHQTGKLIHIDWPYWNRSNRSDNEFASMLSFSMDKTNYVKDEMITLTFPSPSAGRALISVETSEKVINKYWIETQVGETVHSFKATADMAPNAFIHVTMIQPHHATKNDLPIRLYGVMPVFVDDPNTHLSPLIIMPDQVRPESTVSITVKEEKGNKMTYTLAIVDEGLLDLTAFKTPQPWNNFYAKEALGVKTWDMYNHVIGAYGGKMENLYTIGGDATNIVGNGPKANRFKPMVKFIGPFSLNANQSKTHKIEIPNYVGSVRVMVVARDDESYGNAEKTIKVKKPLMLLATAPRVLGPQEELAIPVDVFAMEKFVKNVTLTFETNDFFELQDSKTKTVQFTEIGDQIVNFKVKIKNKIGIGKIKVTAKSGNETAYDEIEIDIRPPNPITYESLSFEIEPGKSIQSTLEMNGYSGTNLGSIELSTLPAINLEKRLGSLIHYPHGCLEQTTSAVFPQLYLANLCELKANEQADVTANIKAGIKRLNQFQNSEGGFGYWPGERNTHEWGTNYAGHFILEAEKQGYVLPSQMKNRWISYQKDQARNWLQAYSPGTSLYESSQLTQAYRLYLLALANKAEIGAMNRLREERKLSNVVKWRLAAAYYIIGQKEVAQKLVQTASIDIKSYKELSETFGSDKRDMAIILECASIVKSQSKAQNLLKLVASELSSKNWMSTQETGYGLLAVAKYLETSSNTRSTFAELTIDSGNFKSIGVGKKIVKQFITENNLKNRLATIKNAGNSSLFVTITTQKIPLLGNEKSFSKQLEINVRFTDFSGLEIKAEKIKQGTEFIAEVTIKNLSKQQYYQEMTLNQLFPSGWEIHNARLFGGEIGGDESRYQDIRDDRVYSYYDLGAQKSKTIKIQLNASYIGKFYLPASYSEAMYDHQICAQSLGKWIEVVE